VEARLPVTSKPASTPVGADQQALPGGKFVVRIRDLQVESLPLDALKPRARNPRTHSKKQLCQIAESIKTFGWTNPILIDADNCMMAGHGRLAAAMLSNSMEGR